MSGSNYKNKIRINNPHAIWKKIASSLIWVLLFHFSFAQSIDIGIFESTESSDQIDIKIRPDFNIEADETITAILYTVRWDDPLITINTAYIFPFFIAPQGTAVENDGYYYQVFAAVPVNAQAFAANQEYIASSFSFSNGECAFSEIIEDEWTSENNGNVYFEFLGEDVTGFIYEPVVEFGSVGGFIEGEGTIHLGESTNILTLINYSGNINTWQHKLDEGEWVPILSTSGLDNYSEIPTTIGIWQYRCEVQQTNCAVDFSEPAEVIVQDTLTHLPNRFKIENNELEISSTGKNIHIQGLNTEQLKGKILVHNLLGINLLDADIFGSNDCSFHLETQGIVIVNYLDETSGKRHFQKVILK